MFLWLIAMKGGDPYTPRRVERPRRARGRHRAREAVACGPRNEPREAADRRSRVVVLSLWIVVDRAMVGSSPPPPHRHRGITRSRGRGRPEASVDPAIEKDADSACFATVLAHTMLVDGLGFDRARASFVVLDAVRVDVDGEDDGGGRGGRSAPAHNLTVHADWPVGAALSLINNDLPFEKIDCCASCVDDPSWRTRTRGGDAGGAAASPPPNDAAAEDAERSSPPPSSPSGGGDGGGATEAAIAAAEAAVASTRTAIAAAGAHLHRAVSPAQEAGCEWIAAAADDADERAARCAVTGVDGATASVACAASCDLTCQLHCVDNSSVGCQPSEVLESKVSLHMQRTMPRRLALVFFWAFVFFRCAARLRRVISRDRQGPSAPPRSSRVGHTATS